MAFVARVPPRQWSAVGPTHWVWHEGGPLGDDAPVRVEIHPSPLRVHVEDLVQGLDVRDQPPSLDEEPTRESL